MSSQRLYVNVYITIIKYRIQANVHRLVNEQTVIHQYNRIRKNNDFM